MDNKIFKRGRVGRFLTAMTLTTLLTSCGSLKVRDKQEKDVATIKTLALVAMNTVEPVPAEIGLNLGSGKAEGMRGMGEFQGKGEHADAMYLELQKAITKKLRWKTLSKNQMISNAGYKAAYEKTMKGWQNKMPPGEGRAQIVVKDVMDWDSIRILGQKGRDQLIQDLKVDAIMVAMVTVSLGGTSIMGFGPRKPSSLFSFQIYKRGVAEPIWFDGNIKGKEMPSVGGTAIWSRSKLQKYALESATDAFSKINEKRK